MLSMLTFHYILLPYLRGPLMLYYSHLQDQSADIAVWFAVIVAILHINIIIIQSQSVNYPETLTYRIH